MMKMGHRLASSITSGFAPRILTSLAVAVLCVAMPGQAAAAPAADRVAPVAGGATRDVQTQRSYKPSLPLFFEKNEGQMDRRAGFMARMPEGTLYLTGADAVLVHEQKGKDKASALEMHWVGASPSTPSAGEAAMAGKSNYFVGKDAASWRTGVENFQQVRQDGLYPGVDLVYYGNQEQLEYDLTLEPGARASTIRLRIEGAKSVTIDQASGDLMLVDAIGSPVRLLKPVVYQTGRDQKKTSVLGSYALAADNTVSFVLGDYDHTQPLVIDPQVVYSTVFGGSTLKTANEGYTPYNIYTGMTVDSSGDVYLSGVTSTINLPATAGAFQTSCNLYYSNELCSNFFVAKFNPNASGAASLVYATYIGNTAQDYNYGQSGTRGDLAVDANGDAYIVGTVENGTNWDGNFPTTANAYVQTCTVAGSPTCSGFLTKLNPAGSALLYSTWLADSYSLAEPGMVAVDGNQIAYIAGSAGSATASEFLAAFDTTKSGNASYVYAVGLPFYAQCLAVDPSGNSYVGGESYHSTENGTGSYSTLNFNGAVTAPASNAFPGILAVFNPAGQSTYATLFGTGQEDAVRGVAVDPGGIVYVTGNAYSLTQVNGLPSGVGATQGSYVGKVNTTLTGAASVPFLSYIYAGDTGNETFAAASNGSGLFAFGGIAGTSTYPVVDSLVQPVNAPSASPEFVGMIDTSKASENALIFLSYLDGVDEVMTLFMDPPSGVNPSPDLFVAGYGLSGVVSDPFLTGSSLTSYATQEGSQEYAPFFYKIALGPIDCLTVSPASLTFPSQELGTTSPALSSSVTNSCTSAVSIPEIVASAGYNESDGCVPELSAGASCNVNVTFEPTALSTAASPTNGTIAVNVTGYTTPLDVSVSGVGVSATTPTAFVSPQNLAFSPQIEGTVSAPVLVAVTNTGSTTLTYYGQALVSTSTQPSAAFKVSTSIANGCGTSLVKGATCYFQVTFAPTTTTALYIAGSSYTQTVTIGGPTTPLTMNLTGSYTPPAPIASLSAGSISYPATEEGVSSGPMTVTLTNTGSATLNIASITLGGTNAGSFLLTGSCAAGGTVVAQGNCSVGATFKPGATGPLQGYITIADNASPTTQTVTLTGDGLTDPGTLTSPTPGLGTTLAASNVAFTWAGSAGITEYQLWLGNSGVGSKNVYNSGGTTATSVTVASLPTDGATLYARLYSEISGSWYYYDYVYAETGTPTPATLASPTAGTTLGTSGVNFQWSGNSGITEYQLWLGTTGVGSKNVYNSGGTFATSVTVGSIPAGGVTVYARLYSEIGGAWYSNDYVYTESGTPSAATLSSPSPGAATVLGTSNVNFTWSTGNGVTEYILYLGTTGPGSKNLYNSGGTFATSATAPSLPANGVTVYARLYSEIDGAWQYNDYIYTEQ